MKQIVLRYGLLSGAFAAFFMTAVALYAGNNVDLEYGHELGYTGILLSMIFVYFGVRTYRDQLGGGSLSFGKGFQVGLLIAVISCLCYVLAWMVIYPLLMPDFMEQYIQHTLEKLQQSGATPAEIEQQAAEMQEMKEMYKNPFIRAGITFFEPFHVGLGAAILSALVLRKKPASQNLA